MSSRREAPPASRASRLPAPPPLFRPLSANAPEPGHLALRRLLLQRWPGRALLGGLALKLLVYLIEWIAGASVVSGAINTLARIGIIVGGAVVLWWLVKRARARLLWRVRERLIVSYLFIGVVPALLIAVFFLFGISLLVVSVSAHLFMTGVKGIETQAQGIARAVVDELERNEGAPVQAVLDRYVAREQSHFRGLSLVLVPRQVDGRRQTTMGPPRDARGTSLLRAGTWGHATPPDRIPSWVGQDDLTQTLQHGGGDEPIRARGARCGAWAVAGMEHRRRRAAR